MKVHNWGGADKCRKPTKSKFLFSLLDSQSFSNTPIDTL